MRPPRHLPREAILVLLAVGHGCGGDAYVEDDPNAAGRYAVSITPLEEPIAAGRSIALGVLVRDTTADDTRPAPFRKVEWRSSSPRTASVSPRGVVFASRPGTATITAEVGGLSSSVTVSVAPPDTPADTGAVELPRVYLDTRHVAPTGQSIVVAAGGNLQAALNTAQPGDEIVLPAGALYTGNFVLPKKTGTGWITVRTQALAQLPPEGSRVGPSHATLMPRLVSPNDQPVVLTAPGAHHWRLLGLQLSLTASSSYGLVVFENETGPQTLANMPTDLILDRVYLHGTATADVKRCLALNSARSAVVDSYLTDCHSNQAESQAIAGWGGTGPYKIVNNYLAGAGINVLFGGADPAIAGVVPSDIEFRRNWVVKPLAWKGVWQAKNLLELKSGVRVLIEANVFENSWLSSQVGFAFVWWNTNSDGTATWNHVTDITFQYNRVDNVAGGWQMDASQDGTTDKMRRVVIRQNLITRLGVAGLGENGQLYQVQGNIDDLVIEHNTANASIFHFYFLDQRNARFVYRDNLGDAGLYGVYSESGIGTSALQAYNTAGYVFARNVLIDIETGGATLGQYPTNNFYPRTRTAVGFVNDAGGNYRLSASSPYKGQATDGTDPGADIDRLEQMINGVKQ